MRPGDVRFLTIREYRLAKFGHDRATWANYKATAALHGIKIDDRKPVEVPMLSDEQIKARVKAIMED